jgi:RNA 3'-terminal phosphate cyclase (ATP)
VVLRVDGGAGEGGGQIVRSAVAVAAATGIAVEIADIRARRPNPGLQAQHLTAVRAAAAVCGARLAGDRPGSRRLLFEPRHPPRAGHFHFDVAAAREGGSAGSACLVLQTVALPLLLAPGPSEVVVEGGTHLPNSPCFDFLELVWAPALRSLGWQIEVALEAFGFYPKGGGRIRARLAGGRLPAPLSRVAPGALERVTIRAVAASLPAHIPQRMSDRARGLLAPPGVPLRVEPRRVRALSPGAFTFLVAEHAGSSCGFTAFGAPGKPSEQVAEEAVVLLRKHLASGAGLDRWLADQILLPLAFAEDVSVFTTDVATAHLWTHSALLGNLGIAAIALRERDGRVEVEVRPAADRDAARR